MNCKPSILGGGLHLFNFFKKGLFEIQTLLKVLFAYFDEM